MTADQIAPDARPFVALTTEQIRLRCWCDPRSKCWHYRTADGRKMPHDGKRQAIWIGGRGAVPITKAAWEAKHQKPVPAGWIAYRTCGSHDCANPAHITAGPRTQHGAMVAASNVWKGRPVRVIACRRSASKQQRLTPELRAWVIESSQTHASAAHALGCSECLVRRVRKQARQRMVLNASSIFAIGIALNQQHREAA